RAGAAREPVRGDENRSTLRARRPVAPHRPGGVRVGGARGRRGNVGRRPCASLRRLQRLRSRRALSPRAAHRPPPLRSAQHLRRPPAPPPVLARDLSPPPPP